MGSEKPAIEGDGGATPDVPDVVDPTEPLHRRFRPTQWDEPSGTLRVAALLGREPVHRVSVDRGLYRTIDQSLADAPTPGFGVAAIRAQLAEQITGLPPEAEKVAPCEETPEGNPAHAVILLDEAAVTAVDGDLAQVSTAVELAAAMELVHPHSREAYKAWDRERQLAKRAAKGGT